MHNLTEMEKGPGNGGDFQHSMKRRRKAHNYYKRGTYMLTMVIAERRPLLGELETERSRISMSPLGKEIRFYETRKIEAEYPMVKVWRVCIMPDHIHMIVHVSDDMPLGIHLGHVIKGFKIGCNQAYRQHCNVAEGSLFEEGYCDRVLLGGREQLLRWKQYLSDNPRRLAIKRQFPQFFHTIYAQPLCGRNCQLYGNQFLLDIPNKMAVVVHRRYSDSEYEELRRKWLACGERGGVLVSAAISQREKDVMREAMNRGYCLIYLRNNGFPPQYKPPGEFFDACAEGRLLEISPWDYYYSNRMITRQECLLLNALAEGIAIGDGGKSEGE